MENGIYHPNIQIPLTFTYGVVLESICIHHLYKRHSPAIRYNVLNSLRIPLNTRALAGGLNCELISHLTLHSNEYVHSKLGNNGKFVG